MKTFLAIIGLLLFSTVSYAGNLEWEAKEKSNERTIGGRWMMSNHFNEFVTDADYFGKFQIIFFGYTFCPDVCPTSLSNIAEAMDELEGMKEEFQPLFISVDPERDTPTVLREYVRNFHPSIIGLTGPANLIKRTADLFKVKYSKVPASDEKDEHYLIDHSAGVYFMSPGGRFIRKFAHGLPGKDMAKRIKEIIAESKGQ
ncbi:SCO1/SenC [Marinobacterium sp. xm-a-121]|jgi:cytochrome oxidase Cu insertion factor (SCO1/SenC/PrrC family)|nr:SCO family protein [Marinobacterium sp. xm-d-420]NRP09101.1 SCO1/SenC [Marinobacterium sp. xm-g-48]NRP39605.1 SCO1/SenC [Marinobacterium sp. xm-a-121]NRP53522.1 SCO1/SenC [Marinobacterium sp. xm-v-242]NRP56763.1 SCO1/SenC [Marinobacterium sp. xm-d-510]NRP77772.1 SCO1/SenC [Marinobacterium sp. xm-m-383]NRP82368.1 SCO1/SenC [Marinobacterium sp. xm-d-509]NRP95364.1 SCO1/SenC [Marinobacterium sp. xm-g-59]NRP96448.1 SCO1/SenC [Marinobacterium sp. xm-a-127]NRQ00694.1 SCO1/SenC [Marinobacteriu